MFKVIGHTYVDTAAVDTLSTAAIGVCISKNIPANLNDLCRQIMYIGSIGTNNTTLKQCLADNNVLRVFNLVTQCVVLNDVYYQLLEDTDLVIKSSNTTESTHKLLIISGNLKQYRDIILVKSKSSALTSLIKEIYFELIKEGLKTLWQEYDLTFENKNGKEILCLKKLT